VCAQRGAQAGFGGDQAALRHAPPAVCDEGGIAGSDRARARGSAAVRATDSAVRPVRGRIDPGQQKNRVQRGQPDGFDHYDGRGMATRGGAHGDEVWGRGMRATDEGRVHVWTSPLRLAKADTPRYALPKNRRGTTGRVRRGASRSYA